MSLSTYSLKVMLNGSGIPAPFLASSVVGTEDAFEICGSSHRVVEKINTHLVTEFILFSLEGLVLTDSLGVIGNPRLMRTVMN